jgi:WD40 repeat protein
MLSVRESRSLPQPEIDLHDLTTGIVERLHLGEKLQPLFALDADGFTWVGGGADGVIRVGRIGRTGVHLLAGHEGPISAVAISPDKMWIASSGEDKTLRLWPMPDLDQPPLHTLPHAELLAKLNSLTNLRAVRDPESATGWTIEIGPFPGWETSPTW